MKHSVVRTDKVYGTDNRTGVVSLRYQKGNKNADIDNGNVVLIESLEDGSREVYKAVDVKANSPITDVVIIASPEVIKDERKRNLDDFYNEAGIAARGYRFHSGDIISVTKDALIGVEPAKGKVVELAAGTKMNVADSATESSTVVGRVEDIENVGRYTYIVIKVD